MNWLQEHMRKHLVEAHGHSNVLSLRPQPSDEQLGLRAVELAERAIEHVRDTERKAADRHACAEALARNAIQKLNKAEDRVRVAESAHRSIEAQLEQAYATMRNIEIELERTAADAAAAQTRILAAQEEAREAEKRATEAENALKRIEAILETMFLQKRLPARQIAA